MGKGWISPWESLGFICDCFALDECTEPDPAVRTPLRRDLSSQLPFSKLSKNVQGCPRRVPQKTVVARTPLNVYSRQECLTRASHKNGLLTVLSKQCLMSCSKECLDKNISKGLPTWVSPERVSRRCLRKMPYKSVSNECPRRLSQTSIFQDYFRIVVA